MLNRSGHKTSHNVCSIQKKERTEATMLPCMESLGAENMGPADAKK
jgi:hypothetical protein